MFHTIFRIFVAISLLFTLDRLHARTMNFEDIITIGKPRDVQLASDGKHLAYITRKGDLQINRNRDILYLGDVNTPSFNKVAEHDEILQMRWSRDSSTLFVLSKDESSYQIMAHGPHDKKVILKKKEPIAYFTTSIDERTVFFVTTRMRTNEKIKELRDFGYVYDPEENSIIELERPENDDVWSLNLSDHVTHLLFSIPYGNWLKHLGRVIESLLPADDAKYLLVSIHRFGDADKGEVAFSNDVAVWDLMAGNWALPRVAASRPRELPTWIGNNKFVYQVVSFSDLDSSGLYVYDLATGDSRKLKSFAIEGTPLSQISWDKKNSILYVVAYNKTVYRVDPEKDKSDKINIANISEHASFDGEFKHVAFVSQSSNEPPEIFFSEIGDQQPRKLTDLNPHLPSITHGHVEKISEKTKGGLPIKGYLVHPVQSNHVSKHPIIIATYGFSGDYIADAEWHSSFPAQTLAGEGYYVLLLNTPPETGQDFSGDFHKAQELEGGHLQEVFEEAVDLVGKKGGDTTKVGIYGWSHGGFVVNYLLTRSKKFQAASLGEGGDYMPGEFVYGGPLWQKIFLNIFGGPPWGDTLKNYFNFSPYFQVEKVNTPLLFEYARLEYPVQGMEMYAPLRYLKVPAEIVLYDGEEHNFAKPRARFASMGRKVDWFNFWLLGKKDPSPNKTEQYTRWEKMKKQREAYLNSNARNTCLQTESDCSAMRNSNN